MIVNVTITLQWKRLLYLPTTKHRDDNLIGFFGLYANINFVKMSD